jgi:hypothetical protein
MCFPYNWLRSKNCKSDKACEVDAHIKTWFIIKYDGLHRLSFHQKEQNDLFHHAYHVNNDKKKKINIKIGRMSSLLCFKWAYYKIRLIISIFKKWFGRVNKCFYYEWKSLKFETQFFLGCHW